MATARLILVMTITPCDPTGRRGRRPSLVTERRPIQSVSLLTCRGFPVSAGTAPVAAPRRVAHRPRDRDHPAFARTYADVRSSGKRVHFNEPYSKIDVPRPQGGRATGLKSIERPAGR